MRCAPVPAAGTCGGGCCCCARCCRCLLVPPAALLPRSSPCACRCICSQAPLWHAATVSSRCRQECQLLLCCSPAAGACASCSTASKITTHTRSPASSERCSTHKSWSGAAAGHMHWWPQGRGTVQGRRAQPGPGVRQGVVPNTHTRAGGVGSGLGGGGALQCLTRHRCV